MTLFCSWDWSVADPKVPKICWIWRSWNEESCCLIFFVCVATNLLLLVRVQEKNEGEGWYLSEDLPDSAGASWCCWFYLQCHHYPSKPPCPFFFYLCHINPLLLSFKFRMWVFCKERIAGFWSSSLLFMYGFAQQILGFSLDCMNFGGSGFVVFFKQLPHQ